MAAVSVWFVKVILEVLARLWSFESRMRHIIVENGISLIQKRQVKNREAADLQKRTSVPGTALLKRILTRMTMMQNVKLMLQDWVEKTEAQEMQKPILIVRFKEQRQPAIQ